MSRNSSMLHTGYGTPISVTTSANLILTQFAGLIGVLDQFRALGIWETILNEISAFLPTAKRKTIYSAVQLFAQRFAGLVVGKEDLNDAPMLNRDEGFKIALGVPQLASTSTLCRFENDTTEQTTDAMTRALHKLFINHSDRPRVIFLDADSTPIPLHGYQEGLEYNGHYRSNCYLPLVVFANGIPVHVVNAGGTEDGRNLLEPIVFGLIDELQAAFPNAQIVLRADAGFNRDSIIQKLEEKSVYYLIGFGVNKVIQKIVVTEWAPEVVRAFSRPLDNATVVRALGDLPNYQARSWTTKRRVIVRDQMAPKPLITRAEREAGKFSEPEEDTRLIITNIPKEGIPGWCSRYEATAQNLYEHFYCQRASECENRIQTLKTQAYGKRASCKSFQTNTYRLLLSALVASAMTLLQRIVYAGFEHKGGWSDITLNRLRDEVINLVGKLNWRRGKWWINVPKPKLLCEEGFRILMRAPIKFCYPALFG